MARGVSRQSIAVFATASAGAEVNPNLVVRDVQCEV
jgi:hypothetical protein